MYNKLIEIEKKKTHGFLCTFLDIINKFELNFFFNANRKIYSALKYVLNFRGSLVRRKIWFLGRKGLCFCGVLPQWIPRVLRETRKRDAQKTNGIAYMARAKAYCVKWITSGQASSRANVQPVKGTPRFYCESRPVDDGISVRSLRSAFLFVPRLVAFADCISNFLFSTRFSRGLHAFYNLDKNSDRCRELSKYVFFKRRKK